ncbi:MAG: ribonuclease HI [Deltaproteobacteria bacterium]|nr:ribonuclease HI [Deltaproteobacteria bacterium]
MAKTKKKIYAVATGRKPGIYTEWFGSQGAEVQIRGFAGAKYKGFATRAEAENWLVNPSAVFKSKKPGEEAIAETPDETEGYIVIYTDGSSINNPGPGGYGVVIIHGEERKEISGGFRKTTNNRMELMGAIVGLKQFEKPARIILHTDSLYVVNGIMKGWAEKWRKNDWMRSGRQPAENCDLWQQLLELTEKHEVIFKWVKGHAGHIENERCDELARTVSAMDGLGPDINYEQGRTTVVQPLF